MKTNQTQLEAQLKAACKKIAPVWSLENFVAVNPYLGLVGHDFDTAAALLAKTDDVKMTLPTSFYLHAIHEGKITQEDLSKALIAAGKPHTNVEEWLNTIEKSENSPDSLQEVQTLADVATEVTGKNWNRLITDRISHWASAYFDEDQAQWNTANKDLSLFAAWKEDAQTDRTPAMMGVKGFHKMVENWPQHPIAAAELALTSLDLPSDGLDLYLHRLLLKIGGWSAYAARVDWDNELYGGKDGELLQLLAVILTWEACLMKCLDSDAVGQAWLKAKKQQPTQEVKNLKEQLNADLILQNAYDLSAQRTLIAKFEHKKTTVQTESTPKVQAIFCIDVRSEVYRRNLESVSSEVATLGFAGFFAFPIKHIPLAHDTGNAQCPVLLPTGPTIVETIDNESEHLAAIESRKLKHQVSNAWNSFKTGAISCFSFVGPVGLVYLPKLFTDSFGITRPVPHPESEGLKKASFAQRTINLEPSHQHGEATGIPLEQRIQMAKGALNAMSLTSDFARLVLIVGHGSSTVNNPHATGLDCGACGGHTGEANARVAAAVLNDAAVRSALIPEGIEIPETTYFVACQHDTTTDDVTLFSENQIPNTHQADVLELKEYLAKASHCARAERALRFHLDAGSSIDTLVKDRSKDWAQVRPEWGLAGCSAFVVAPRHRTMGIDLQGRSFLHSYDWKNDKGFGVLELIMTAPMVVTSWISLQYYASTVDNKHYGSGNKTLHNVTGGIGVLEGYAGDLRVGLPWQSVHDGTNYQHEPLRLSVIIEAPMEAMNCILEKHEGVRQLCDNGWLFLLAMDADGKVSHKYTGNLSWEGVKMTEAVVA